MNSTLFLVSDASKRERRADIVCEYLVLCDILHTFLGLE